MAEGGTRTISCRYFLNGVCREGSNCHFSHDRRNSRPSLTCRYYIRGLCTYGENCRYDHVRPERNEDRTSRKMNLGTNKKAEHTAANISQNVSSQREPAVSQRIVKPLPSHARITASNTTAKSLNPVHHKKHLSLCVDAPEFVPRAEDTKVKSIATTGLTFAQVVGEDTSLPQDQERKSLSDPDSELCPFFLMSGNCQLERCTYIHGLLCDMCQLACLHPHNEKQRNKHIEECTRLMEAEMEHSFAVARSREKVCGICMDIVMERAVPGQRRFGILPNCSHCFCLDCLRKWRQSKQFENKIVRACPECRVQSDYVIPSRYWVDDKDKNDKEKLVSSYKEALRAKPCKYFKEGEGQCPFGNKCFYRHALPDGTEKDVGPPKRRRRFNADGELEIDLSNMVLWDFIDEREHRLELLRGSIQTLLLQLQLEDLAEDLAEDLYFPDESFSDASDLEFY